MNWQRWRIPLMLAPTMLIIIVLFVGSLGYSFLQSLGYQPTIGNYTLSLDAYANVMFSERYAQQFWQGLGLTVWVAAASTFISAALAIACALLLRQTFVGKRLSSFLFQLNLPVPHLVIAIGMLFLFSQSGLVSRGTTAMGLIERPNQFPILVRDPGGIGIILTYIWKEVPFFGIIVLAILQSLGEDYEDLARSLGANRWQRFRYVLLPLIMPGLLSASIIVFAFAFGTYEIPKLLGVRFPEMLPVMALDFFLNPDLNSRAEGMALSMIIALIVLVLVIIYMSISNRAVRRA
ncbi:MAG: ABC transporter permease subunit [Chloroflexi bacterium]|nr:ABC transporter permease subunit [Chloroflexota bacterium]